MRPVSLPLAWLAAASVILPTAAAARPDAPGTPDVRAARTVEFEGMCDASGAVTVAGGRFVVADDEDNVLRLYDARRGGPPVLAVDLSSELELPHKKRAPETDLEAATRLGDRAFWLTSHGRNSKAKKQESRLRFFSTTLPDASGTIRLAGKPYTGLLDDLLQARGLARYGLREAETRAPKEPGGLNIEGMTARPDGRSVVIGFRNPLPQGRALLLPLLNPLAMMDGQRAQLGPPVLVDLQGRGVRSISFWKGSYLLIGGGIAAEKTSMLFRWDGRSESARPVVGIDLADLNPEAFASFEDRDQLMLLSDDGERLVAGEPCKKLKDASRKRFRGRWVKLP